MKTIFGSLAILALCSFWVADLPAQNPDFPGHLGVYVMPGDYGMQIRSFIPNTPAQELSQNGDLARNDTIIKLGGKPTRSLQDLIRARNRIPEGKEAKMVMKDRDGGVYHIWIWRSNAIAAAPGPGFQGPLPQQNLIQMRVGGQGEGGKEDFRDPAPPAPPAPE